MNVLATALVALLPISTLLLGNANAQPARQPVEEVARDDAGMEWYYEERADEIDDRWQVLIMGTVLRGTVPGASIGMLCVEGMGRSVRITVPGWNFGAGQKVRLQARVDRREPFEVTAVGEAIENSMAHFREEESGGREAFGMLSAASERIVIRNPDGRTVVFPMSGKAPLGLHGMIRCLAVLLGKR